MEAFLKRPELLSAWKKLMRLKAASAHYYTNNTLQPTPPPPSHASLPEAFVPVRGCEANITWILLSS